MKNFKVITSLCFACLSFNVLLDSNAVHVMIGAVVSITIALLAPKESVSPGIGNVKSAQNQGVDLDKLSYTG